MKCSLCSMACRSLAVVEELTDIEQEIMVRRGKAQLGTPESTS